MTEQGRGKDLLLPALYEELRTDVLSLLKVNGETFAKAADLTAIEKRAFVKAVFSYIEALTFALKDFALHNCGDSLTPAEQLLAREQSFEVGDDGELEERVAKIRTLSNIRFAFRLAAKVDKVSFRLDVSKSGWQELRRALKVRDRLMHPKRREDLSVSEDEFNDALGAFTWFSSNLVLLLATGLLERREAERSTDAPS